MKTRIAWTLLAAFAAAGSLFGQDATPGAAPAPRETPPAPAPPKAFQVPARKTFQLENGLKVSLVPYGTIPKVRVELSIRSGNVNEKPDEVWLADLTGDLMREGTKTRTATQISEASARMGGELEVDVSADFSEIGGEVLSEFAAEYVDLVADVAMNPSFPESELARRRSDKIRELSIARSQPQPLAQEAFRKAIYGDHPYARLFPTEAMLSGYGLEDIRGFYDRNFGAARAHLYVAGRFDAKAVEDAVRKSFASWKAGTPQDAPTPSPKSERAIHFVDRPNAVQSTLILGLPVVDPTQPDYVPMLVTNTLLGGFFSSRITANLREDKGYTYSPFSQVSTRFRDAYWAEQADVTTAVTGASIKEILYEIDRLRTEAPPAAELKAVQNYMSGVFVLQNSSRNGIINQLEFVDLHGLPDSYLRDFVRSVGAVTPEGVQAMATKHLVDSKLTIVVVGDRKTVEAQVRPYGKIL